MSLVDTISFGGYNTHKDIFHTSDTFDTSASRTLCFLFTLLRLFDPSFSPTLHDVRIFVRIRFSLLDHSSIRSIRWYRPVHHIFVSYLRLFDLLFRIIVKTIGLSVIEYLSMDTFVIYFTRSYPPNISASTHDLLVLVHSSIRFTGSNNNLQEL